MKKLAILLFFILPMLSFSQKEAAIWYFGEYAGLDFNSGVPVVLTDGQINTFEGCATISDNLGNLLFYTDGVTVWDNSHTIMPNGNGLLGNTSSTQSAIIIPKPNNLNQYYIFSVDQRGIFPLSDNGIHFTTVDMTLNGGLGDVIASEKNQVLLSRAFEKITAVIHNNNNSFWVVSLVEDKFYSWLVDAAGVNTTPIISIVTEAKDSRGYLKISPDGIHIASATFGNSQSLMLYDFDTSTGIVSNEQQLNLNETDDIPYGVEFSTSGSKLYVTTSKLNGNEHIPPSKLIQYNMTSADVPNSGILIHTSNVNTRGAVQLAIDGKIYRTLSISGTIQEGTKFLGVINAPEADGLACNYVHDAIDISNGDNFRKTVEGLPPFIQSFFLNSISANDVCFGSATQFNLNSTTPPTSITWDFGDPSTGGNNTSTLLNPTHIFSAPGVFTVTATIVNGGTTTVSTIEITIYDLPVVTSPVTLLQCDDDTDGIVDFNLEDANSLISSETPAPVITYFLTEADAIANTNPIANPTAFSNSIATTVWARVENATNCFVTAQVILQVTSTDIPSSLMIVFDECDTDSDGDNTNGLTTFDFSSATSQILTALLPATNLVVSYYETMADALATTNAIDETNYTTITANSQLIAVRVDDLNNGCYGLGFHVTLNTIAVPKFDLATDISYCEDVTNKVISVENPSAAYTYLWTDSLGNTVGSTQSITVSTSGLYTVVATDTSGTNCTNTKAIQVTINAMPVINSPALLIQCDDNLDGIVDFNLEEAATIISSEIPAPTFTYFLTEADAIANTNPITNPTTFSNSIATTVWARVENASNCFVTAEINLQVTSTNIPADLMIVFNECDTDFDGDSTNGITTFDFSSATDEVLNSLLPETDLTVSYYETISDALAEINTITPTNYQNTTANSQQIVVRVDNLSNECFGLGYHVTLNVDPIPQFDLLPEITFCFLSEIHTISIENPIDSYTYVWKDSQNNNIGNTPEITITQPDIYTVTATLTTNNCENTKAIEVKSAPVELLPNFDSNSIEVIDNQSNSTIIVLTERLPVSTYEYALDDADFQESNVFENVLGGLHIVKIRDLENCLEASLEVAVISVPNFFTPNNDGFNDTWHVSGIEFQPTSNVYVFDRFGKLIVILDPLGPGWDGFYKGNPLPSTDYWYKVELEDSRVLKGHFSLIR